MKTSTLSEETMKSYSAALAAQEARTGDALAERVLLDQAGGNPMAPEARGVGVVSTDICGAFSVETFAAASSLRYTHEDAKGWLDYLSKFHHCNFWYRDAGVGVWAYYEQFDNWQDTYGMDAVRAVYHSGHGGMDGNGVFYAAMGSNWAGQGTNAISTKMALGNEQVRYIFWSTCFSLRVTGGHNPIRTWAKSNLGWRMLFGYETTSVDKGNYGQAFWSQWNKKKSFSQAFLDASWYDVSRNQAPSVCACGASATEAKNRIDNERLLYGNPVSSKYWYWRWYSAAASALGARAPSQKLPRQIVVAQLAPEPGTGKLLRGVLGRVPVGLTAPTETVANPAGVIVIQEGDRRVSVDANGTYEVQLQAANHESLNELQIGAAIRKAEDVVRQFGLDRNNLAFDRVLHKYDCSGNTDGSGEIGAPKIIETVVQFTQLIDGVPVVSPGDGMVSITLDNDQNVIGVVDRTRPVARLMEAMALPPAETGKGEAPPIPVADITADPEQLLADAWQDQLRSWVVRGRMPERYSVVPGTCEIGYAIRGNTAELVAREEIEADCGGGFLKRFEVELPLRG